MTHERLNLAACGGVLIFICRTPGTHRTACLYLQRFSTAGQHGVVDLWRKIDLGSLLVTTQVAVPAVLVR